MKLKQAVSNVVAYTQPKPSKVNPGTDTSGNIPVRMRQADVDTLCMHGALAGGIQGGVAGLRLGGLSGGAAGLVSGAVGGLVGNKVGYKSGNFKAAIASGALAGALTSAAVTAAMTVFTGQPLSLVNVAGYAVMGGLSGMVGQLSGSRRAATKDSVYGGFIAGNLAQSYTRNGLTSLAAAAGAGLSGPHQDSSGKKLATSVLGGAALGAVTSLPYFLAGSPFAAEALMEGVVAGAGAATAGAFVGPVARQVTRNVEDDMVSAINKKIDPYLAKNPLGTPGKVAAGAALGVLTLGGFGMLGPVAGIGLLPSMAVTSTAGAALGGYKIHSMIKRKEKALIADRFMQQYIPAGQGIENVLLNLKAAKAE